MRSSKSEWNSWFYIGGKMKLRVLLGLTVICLAVLGDSSLAQGYKCYAAQDTCQVCYDTTKTPWVMNSLDLGVCDTVRIGCPVCVNDLVVGDSFKVPIYLYNDKKLASLSLPFRHNGTYLRFGFGGDYGLDTDGATVLTSIQKAGILFESRDAASALLGWVDFSGTRPIAANTTGAGKLLGYLYLVLTSGVTNPVVRFDSAFYPSAGEWLANNEVAVKSGIQERPKFAICQYFTGPCQIALPVQDVNSGNLPQEFELGQNRPNPFNPNTVIEFAVPRPAEVRVEVFNTLGQRVKTLANEFSKAGYKRVEWDGTDDNGNSVASGVYLYRMTAGDFSETKKMLLLK